MSAATTTTAAPAATPAERTPPAERLAALCDPGSLRLLRTAVRSDRLGDRAVDGDGVVAASGLVGGRPILCYAEDQGFMGGSLGGAHAASIVELLKQAERGRRPVVGLVSSAGARLQEGLAALAGYGEIFAAMTHLSGVVPQISILSGVSAGGGAYSPALGDVVIMTRDASMFLTGPGVVRDVMGEDVDAISLGGAKVQSANGVCHMVAGDEGEAALMARDLLGLLPSAAGDALPIAPPLPALDGDPGDVVPGDPRKVYDVRDVLRRIVDDGWLLQYGELWARNIVCAWARVEGRPVGIVANQPRYIGGVLDAEAAQKAARFVRTCHLFGVPLVAFVDTPGFMPGTKQESAGVIRHGAKLVHAFAEARVPKLTVTLRKSFGGAHIAMNSKALGADICFAWPQATLGVMGAEQAVNIVHRRHLAAAEDVAAERATLAAAYAEEHLGAQNAAAQGYVDEVIEPSQTRDRLAAALSVLDRTPVGEPRAGNVPL
ncbi:MAG TPA: carboxyl transferase domain-containing protein [Solirubrobacteraceae bacterium]|nr:carboxyl transferase domain-containing protein [Solirubrobacteraceae bacterium]